MTEWGGEMCPECHNMTVYRRKTRTPEYRCQGCGHEFDTDDGDHDPIVCGLCGRPAQYRVSHMDRCSKHAPWRVSV